MTLDDLRVFAAVCEARSLSAVARELGCTQSAVSQHVRRLEKEVGAVLVERGRRGVSPTPAGAAMYTAALDSLSAVDGGCRRVREISSGQSGPLRISTGGTTLRHFMGTPLVRFRHRRPDAIVEFRSGT